MPALPLDWSIVMRTSFNYVTNRTIGYLVAFLLLLCPHTASAITYMSIETVPNRDVVGDDVSSRFAALATPTSSAGVSDCSASVAWSTP